MSTYSWRIYNTVNKVGFGRCHLAFAVANCVLNRRFAAVTVGGCGDCWKLWWLLEAAMGCWQYDGKFSFYFNSYFSVQLQQTEISDRKLFIFQHGIVPSIFGTICCVIFQIYIIYNVHGISGESTIWVHAVFPSSLSDVLQWFCV